MSFEKLVDGPLFDGQLPRQMLVQSNGHVWAVTYESGGFVGMHLYKSTDGGSTFEINTTYDLDVGDVFIAEDADGRLWRISFWDTPQQWSLERSNSGVGDDWIVIGASPVASIYIGGPFAYYDNSLSGLVCHPTNPDVLAFGGNATYTDDAHPYGLCPIWTVTDGATINQYLLPTTDYDLGLATDDVLFTQDGRLLAAYSYWQATGSIRIVSCAYSDDYSTFTEVQLLPEYNIDDFGWYEHLYGDADGGIYCIFGRDIPTVGEHCWMWDGSGNCTANQTVYDHGFFVVKSTDGISWTIIWDMHVPESAEAGFNQPLPYDGYLYQTYVPGSNVSGIMHDGTLLHVWFQAWSGFPGPVDPGLSIYWTYNGTTWTEQPMFGPGGANAFLSIGAVSNKARVIA